MSGDESQTKKPSTTHRLFGYVGCSFLVVVLVLPSSLALLMYYEYYLDFRVLEEHLLPETYRRGDVLVEHLMSYRADHGAFPPDLDLLVETGYTNAIEQPTWGDRKWEYMVLGSPPGGFSLSVERYGDSYPGIYYANGHWTFDH